MTQLQQELQQFEYLNGSASSVSQGARAKHDITATSSDSMMIHIHVGCRLHTLSLSQQMLLTTLHVSQSSNPECRGLIPQMNPNRPHKRTQSTPTDMESSHLQAGLTQRGADSSLSRLCCDSHNRSP